MRGGGHSVAGFGTCDSGLVLDLRRMRGIRVDPEHRTVRAEGGSTLGDLNHAAHTFGLATTGGIISTTGIAGLTLGGGMGYLSLSCGLSCDKLLSADVVTADGGFVTCDKDRESDLYWAIRGGSATSCPPMTRPASGPITGKTAIGSCKSSRNMTRPAFSISTRTSNRTRDRIATKKTRSLDGNRNGGPLWRCKQESTT